MQPAGNYPIFINIFSMAQTNQDPLCPHKLMIQPVLFDKSLTESIVSLKEIETNQAVCFINCVSNFPSTDFASLQFISGQSEKQNCWDVEK
jgi:hypothetical protein